MVDQPDPHYGAADERAEFWRIADVIPAAIWYKDTHNRILRLNRAAAAIHGLPVTAIEGQSVYDLDPQYAEQYYADDMRVITSGQPRSGIVEPLITASGEERWLRTDKIPFRDENGAITGVIVFSLDITGQKQTEDSLREANAFLQEALGKIDGLVESGSSTDALRTYIEYAQNRLGELGSPD